MTTATTSRCWHKSICALFVVSTSAFAPPRQHHSSFHVHQRRSRLPPPIRSQWSLLQLPPPASSSSLKQLTGKQQEQEDEDEDDDPNLWEKLIMSVSQSWNARRVKPFRINRKHVDLLTFIRVVVPSVVTGIVAYLLFPWLALSLASQWHNPGTFAVLSQDSSQFVQNFLTVAGLLFSILVGQTYYFLYTQQETIYYSLFLEVTEAKSLLEQVALVCQGRSMYQKCLISISKYVQTDLKQIQKNPALLLSARPVDDPLESIMYMTSVGVPSTVYETVKSLRAARAQRLGALQRKLPSIHMLLLWILAAIELVSFPLLGAGTQTIGGYKILTVEGVLFGVMTAGIVLTLRVVGELWRPAGGAYNVDNTLGVMVSGLEQELQARMQGRKVSKNQAPSGARDWDVAMDSANDFLSLSSSNADNTTDASNTTNSTNSASSLSSNIQTQGGDPSVPLVRLFRWWRHCKARLRIQP